MQESTEHAAHFDPVTIKIKRNAVRSEIRRKDTFELVEINRARPISVEIRKKRDDGFEYADRRDLT